MEVAVKIVGVGPVAERHRRHVHPGKAPVRLVEHVDAHFFFHHIALVDQVFFVHFERAHAGGFQPQHALQRVRGHRFVIVGHVVVRRTVQHATRRIDELDVHHLAGVLRTLEHHVLKQVGKAAAPARLQPESDVVVHAHRHHRRRAVRRYHHAQTIAERRALNRYLQGTQRVSSFLLVTLVTDPVTLRDRILC